MADKMKCEAVGSAVVKFIMALSDGVDLGDVDEFTSLGQAALVAAGEYKRDPDAAIAYTLAGAATAFGDMKSEV